MATTTNNSAPVRRRRSEGIADTSEDVSVAGQGAERIAETKDKMVTVSIERDFMLTSDDHKPVHYKKGIDEMPLSHAKHWFAVNAGGVRLYTGRRAAAPEESAPQEAVMPPKGDPDKIKELSTAIRMGVDLTPKPH